MKKQNIDYNEKVLEVKDLKMHFKVGVGKNKLVVPAVDGLTFDIYKKEVFGLVGESGCGKTTTGRTIIRLYKPTDGIIKHEGKIVGAGFKSHYDKLKTLKENYKLDIIKLNEKKYQRYLVNKKYQEEKQNSSLLKNEYDSNYNQIKEEILKEQVEYDNAILDAKNKMTLAIDSAMYNFISGKKLLNRKLKNEAEIEYRMTLKRVKENHLSLLDGLEKSAALSKEEIKKQKEEAKKSYEKKLEELELEFYPKIEAKKGEQITYKQYKKLLKDLKDSFNKEKQEIIKEYENTISSLSIPDKIKIEEKLAKEKENYNRNIKTLKEELSLLKEGRKMIFEKLDDYTQNPYFLIFNEKYKKEATNPSFSTDQNLKESFLEKINQFCLDKTSELRAPISDMEKSFNKEKDTYRNELLKLKESLNKKHESDKVELLNNFNLKKESFLNEKEVLENKLLMLKTSKEYILNKLNNINQEKIDTNNIYKTFFNNLLEKENNVKLINKRYRAKRLQLNSFISKSKLSFKENKKEYKKSLLLLKLEYKEETGKLKNEFQKTKDNYQKEKKAISEKISLLNKAKKQITFKVYNKIEEDLKKDNHYYELFKMIIQKYAKEINYDKIIYQYGLKKQLTKEYLKNKNEILDEIKKLKKITEKKEASKQALKMQMIFQDPISSLNPRMTVGEIVTEGLVVNGFKNKKENRKRAAEILKLVGLSEDYLVRYPHEFSGGQRQRIGIARALIVRPSFIIADEPVSALDVSIQAQVINLLRELKDDLDLTILFVAHDLSVVKFFCDRIAVMYYGKIVELASSEELFKNPVHPYTKSLLSAIPNPDPESEKVRKRIYYDPSIHDYRYDKPTFTEIRPNHFVLANKNEIKKIKKELGDNL